MYAHGSSAALSDQSMQSDNEQPLHRREHMYLIALDREEQQQRIAALQA